MAEAPEMAIAGQLRWQADACRMIGSPLYAGVLEKAAEDVEGRGATWEILCGHEDDPRFSVLGLRLLGAVNKLVLTGRAPELGDAYRSERPEEAWEQLQGVFARDAAELRESLEQPVQTNEVGRCAALIFGFLAVAGETRLPLRLLEVGASAGLNLRWDRYRYEGEGFAWGPDDSPVRLAVELDGAPAPALPAAIEIVERRGCDASPIDPSTTEGRLALLAYIWPDQRERIARMEAALEVAAGTEVTVERGTAAAWAERVLAEPAPGRATVIYHSIVSQYLSDSDRTAFFEAIRAAGERASAEAPLAWLRMEPNDDRANLELTLWPGGKDRLLGRVGYHGSPVALM